MNDRPDDDQFDNAAPASAVEIIPPSSNVALAWASAEIDKQIATAKSYPRLDDKKMLAKLIPRVTLSIEIAEACVYTLPRGNKNIEGPSIRFAEMVFQTWGNCRVAAEFIGVNREDGLVVVKGTFFDLENNIVTQAIEPRRITGRNGRLYSPDLIAQTAKAALSIAKRNAILGGISPGVIREAYHAAHQFSIGDVKNFEERKVKAFERFSERAGVDKATIFKLLMIDDEGQMRPNHLPILRGFYNAIVQGEETVETLMRLRSGAASQDFEVVADPLKDRPQGDKPAAAETAKAEVQAETSKPEAAKAEPAKAAEQPEPANKPAAETPKADPVVAETVKDEPTDDASYRVHADKWIKAATSITQLDQKWKSEKKLRADCKVSTATLEHLDEVKSNRIDEIRQS